MQITRQTDYAVRAVLYLAQQPAEVRSTTAQIARSEHIPPTFLAKIIAQLAAAGLVQSTRGAHGGIRLARPSAEISLLEVVEAIDGPLLLNACVADPSACTLGARCTVYSVWCQAQADLVVRLGRATFDSLAQLAPATAASPAIA